MASQTITNTTIENSLNESDQWYAALELEDGTVTFADTIAELVGAVIEGYDPEVSEDGIVQAFNDRTDFAVQQANARQGLLALVAADEGEFNPDEESEESLTAIFADRDEFVPVVELWAGKVPLVLIATEYAPYSEIPRPDGNVQWIDPYTDLTLLTSLAALGVLQVRVLG